MGTKLFSLSPVNKSFLVTYLLIPLPLVSTRHLTISSVAYILHILLFLVFTLTSNTKRHSSCGFIKHFVSIPYVTGDATGVQVISTALAFVFEHLSKLRVQMNSAIFSFTILHFFATQTFDRFIFYEAVCRCD